MTPSEHVADLMARVDAAAPAHAHVHVDAEGAVTAASRADRRYRAGGNIPALCGLPVSVKDLLDVAGQPTGRGRAEPAPTARCDSPVVSSLRRAGAVFVGKTRTSEDGWSATTVGPAGPATVNPRLPGRSSGGSSGGAACAVALGLERIAIGTDGAGSVRIPAAWCGVVGFKPSFGRWPYGSRGDVLSHVGVLTSCVADAALTDAVVTGHDGVAPSRSLPTVAWLAPGWSGDADERLRESVEHALDSTVPVRELNREGGHRALVDLLTAGEYPRLVDGDLWRGHDEVARRGARVTPADIERAHRVRKTLTARLDALLHDCDVLALPTVAIPPFAREAEWPPGCDIDTWLEWAENTYLLNLTGHPAISLPWGYDDDTPLGLQLVGRRGNDRDLLTAASAMEIRSPTPRAVPA